MNPSEYLKKMLNGWKFRQNESGQGILEYVLVLVVVVGIILGMLYQFNKSFRHFAEGYFSYIGCLLETGELPGRSNDCKTPNLNFTAQASPGSTLAGGGGRGGAGGSGSSTGGSGSSTDGSGSSASGSGSSGTGSGSGTGGTGSGAGGLDGGQSSSGGDGKEGNSSSNSSGRPGRFNKNNGTSNADANSDRLSMRPERQKLKTNKNDKKSDSKSNSSGLSFRVRNRGRSSALTESVYYVEDEYITEEEKEKKEKTVSGSSRIRKKGQGISHMRKARFDIEVPDFQKMKEESEDSGFSFGFLFKMLIIAGILIAIFIFLGGQVLQIKKSWQK